MRKQFEAWARTCSNPLIDGDFRWMESRDTYYWSVTRGMWEAWQAARDYAAVKMPQRALDQEEGAFFDKGWNACLDQFARLNGVKP
ncbi:hypothetical protein D3C81_1191170 [compost metagenome]